MTSSLRERMRFYKHRVTPNATSIARTFNEQFKPEIISEHNDPYRVDWLDASCNEDVLIGEKASTLFQLRICINDRRLSQALRVVEPEKSGYLMRWPIYGTNFNTRDYNSIQENLSDIEILLRKTLQENINIRPSEYKVRKFVISNQRCLIIVRITLLFLLFRTSMNVSTLGNSRICY